MKATRGTAFGLGRVYLCQQIAGLPAGDSETEFRKVIDDYESGNTRVEELAWESHAGLGVYYATIPPTDYEKAIIEYQAGIDIIDTSVGAALGRPELNERKAIFYGNMADAMRRAADLDEARDAYETAIALTQDDGLRNRLQAELDDLGLGVDN